MSGPVRVLLPPPAAHLAQTVVSAGCTPIVDATRSDVPEIPDGAWVRTLPGRPAPGSGPVVLAELGAPITGRPTWLETSVPREVPDGYAGLVLKGREAGGLCGEHDGLVALAQCPEPGRVILDAGVGPATTASAAALGAAGVLVADTLLGCPEIELPAALRRRLAHSDDEITRVVNGLRVAASPTAPVLRRLLDGEDPWALAAELWAIGDPANHLWIAGQGLALAVPLAQRYGSLAKLLTAYVQGWEQWTSTARAATAIEPPIEAAGTGAHLASARAAAGVGGTVGSAVLWQQARWLGKPVVGEPVLAAAAVGGQVVTSSDTLKSALRDVPQAPRSVASAPTTAPVATAPGHGAAAPAIAIVGMGCRFPGGSNSVDAFWQNIVNGVYAITTVPPDRWNPDLYWDDDRAVPDKTYSKIGGFLQDFVFNSKRFRIPPAVARQVDPVQQITLECVADALSDAGLKVDRRGDGKEFERERTAVILGNSLGGEVSDDYAIRLAWPDVARRLTAVAPFCNLAPDEQARFLADMEVAYKAGLPIIDEDSMPGELANVIAGRIANAFDLGGANFTVDAACASSMAAIQTACKTLQDGDADLVVTGGADRSMNIATYVKFCKIGALSAEHSAPFDNSASGFVMGEGCGILVLKRYEDAVNDGDRVYAVIRGVGGSSDGKGKGITAPNIHGQIRALQRAYADAGLDPWDVDLIEAHGTSTVVGDKVEVEALSEVIGSGHRDGRGPIRIGSVKSMIGHLKSAAGAASVMKAALALYHGVLPPSVNFRNAREDVPLGVIPLAVQDRAEGWPSTPDGLRRAGVSAFGFGGTNFHVVLESFAGQPLPATMAKQPTAPQPRATSSGARPAPAITASDPRPAPEGQRLPAGIWAASGLDTADLLTNLRALADGRQPEFHPSAPLRMASAPRDAEERADQLKRAIRTMEKGSNPDLLRARSIAFEDGPFDGKLALLFTGQGSQYVDMGLDLAAAFPLVQATYDEADRVLAPTLGRGITDFIKLADGEDAKEKAEVLRQTEYSQPATLTLDIAILRLLAAFGIAPDLVAGHSLGEYGAAVAAGVMTFEQALLAVSARGREMASIRLDDPGKMAGIATGAKAVEEILAEVDGYVIPANKNCPTQTVIAGASDAVDEACERFKAAGVTVYPLPVSHAFHSRIVAPASEPLRGVLTRLGLNPPRRPITTNVTGDYYPTGSGAADQIIDLLARQISGPVEWTSQMERMYADGARVFVECGPKRALSGFTVSILKRRPHRALYTNHPKRGGVASFLDSLAGLLALGLPVRDAPTTEVDLFATPEPRRATTQAITAFAELHRTHTEAAPDLEDGIRRIVARTSGYEPAELDLDYELEADLGIDTVKQAEVFSVVRQTYGIAADPDFSFSDHRTLRSLIQWAAERTGATRISVQTPTQPAAPLPPAQPVGTDTAIAQFLTQAAQQGMAGADAERFAQALLPAVQGLLATAFEAARAAAPPPAPAARSAVAQATPAAPAPPQTWTLAGQPYPVELQARIVCSGASIGLPGGDQVFGPDNFARILSGEGRISHIGGRSRDFLDMGLTRLVKDPQTGQGSFLDVTSDDEVIRLAGIEASFDLTDWGIDARMVEAYDIATQLAFAAGIEALRDAGIPLVRTYRTTQTGKRVPRGWSLPEALRDGTGVIFGSAFPGYDKLVRHLDQGGRDAEGRFDRRFLFQVLAMGHSQFAQFIGARGPNTAVNAACASSTQALAIAEDWIRLGRCERVIVVGADDVTSDALLPWIGGGFMAAGAASTHDVVEEAALPFDRRRHGLILGMGAVGLVVEKASAAEARGVVPVAEQLGASIVNSAFHGTRLDVQHIAQAMKALVDDVCAKEGIRPEDLARQGFFMSHETYTPARGGSAAAEIEALRTAFGDSASKLVVSNTKGFTGHPMGAGIEDGVVVKALQYGFVPPVANLREPDEQLGDLTLSHGQPGAFRYAVRLAAGFGSQLALTIYKSVARGDDRISSMDTRARWLREVTGYDHVAEVIEERTLRAVASDRDAPYDLRPDVSPIDALGLQPPAEPEAPTPRPASAPVASPAADSAGVLDDLIAVIAERTGYEPEEIEPDYELEADLGIDTVKQAEILGELTERYGIERNDDFRLADYPTIEALAGYLASASGAGTTVASQPAAAPAPAPKPSPTPAATAAPAAAAAPAPASSSALADLIEVVAEKTGYEPAELEPDFELEADLGIDTVKQAEILGDLTERYGLERDESFRLSDYPTLEKLAAYLSGRRGAPASEPSPAGTPTPTPTSAPAASSTAADDGDETLQTLIAVVADKTGYDTDDLDPTFELEADLGVDTVKQAEILSALQEQFGLAPDEAFRPADHPTLQDLAAYLHQRRGTSDATPTVAPVAPQTAPPAVTSAGLPPSFQIRRAELSARAPAASGGRLDGRRIRVLGSGPVAEALIRRAEELGASTKAPHDVVVDVGRDVRQSFDLAKQLDAEPPRSWVAVTRSGGLGGAPEALDGALSDGAIAGFTKSLGREWSATEALVLDLHPDQAPDDAAVTICDHLASGAAGEWFVDESGAARGVSLGRISRPGRGTLDDVRVALLTGGGRGITARVAEELAARAPVPGMKLALVGRSAVPTEPLDEASAKAEIKARLGAAGGRVTPAMVEAELRPLRRGEEVRQTIERLRGLGAEVAYVRGDLSHGEGAKRVVADVRAQLGPIDLLVHGAGVEESRMIADKDEAAFARVFDGKALGGRGLLDAVDDHAFVVSMGSVAGRFGNPGQVDYAAANDAMARMCHQRPRSLHVDWTAWDDVGMAVRGGMRSLLENRGVDLLPADAGAAVLLDLIAAGVTGEVVVAGALGDFEPEPTPPPEGAECDHPLLDVLEVNGDHARGTRVLTRSRDPWIVDHAIEGTPVLPGVVGLELMTAVSGALFETVATQVHNLRFDAPAKVHRDEPTTVAVDAERVGPHKATARLTSTRTLRTGRIQTVEHFQTELTFGEVDAVDGLPSAFLPEEPVDQASIYQRFFHGPAFQVLTGVFNVSADGLAAEARVTPLRPEMVTDALVLEAAFQAAGLHRMMVAHQMGLPQTLQQLTILRRATPGEVLSVVVQLVDDAYHVDVDGMDGPILRLRGFTMIDRGPVPPADRFREPEGGRPTCFPTADARRSDGGGGPVIAEAHADEDTTPWLRHEELEELSVRGTPRRVRDRVAGRVAAKRAISSLTGVAPHQVSVTSAPSGEPLCDVPGHPGVRVSVTHRAGRAFAVAVHTGFVGIDLERVETRPPSFARSWFDDAERAVIASDPERQTIAWAIKEAVLKLIGTGMACSPHEVRVLDIAQSTATIQVTGEVRRRLADRGGEPVEIAWASAGADEVVVTARSAA
ncbi:MAG: SDR family NAD(P)-dependent oxidoreductase [Myxococcales bacterium]|nr:SDR family NAD(P)-dependent oxidoreductase [Myxococcales bacterium]